MRRGRQRRRSEGGIAERKSLPPPEEGEEKMSTRISMRSCGLPARNPFRPREAGEGDHAKHGGRGASEPTTMRAPTKTIANAQHLRRALSVPEARLWNRLRTRAPGKPVFRRQHPIGPYVLDFYCAKARLAIELDGASHDMGDRPQRDIRRDAWLVKHGVRVLRIPARNLIREIDETADAIVRMAEDLL